MAEEEKKEREAALRHFDVRWERLDAAIAPDKQADAE
jgi:hypothetical protein